MILADAHKVREALFREYEFKSMAELRKYMNNSGKLPDAVNSEYVLIEMKPVLKTTIIQQSKTEKGKL